MAITSFDGYPSASEDRSRGIVRIVVALDSAPLYTLHRCEESFGGVAEEVPPTGSGGATGEAVAAGAAPLTGVVHKTGGEHDNEPHATGQPFYGIFDMVMYGLRVPTIVAKMLFA